MMQIFMMEKNDKNMKERYPNDVSILKKINDKYAT